MWHNESQWYSSKACWTVKRSSTWFASVKLTKGASFRDPSPVISWCTWCPDPNFRSLSQPWLWQGLPRLPRIVAEASVRLWFQGNKTSIDLRWSSSSFYTSGIVCFCTAKHFFLRACTSSGSANQYQPHHDAKAQQCLCNNLAIVYSAL